MHLKGRMLKVSGELENVITDLTYAKEMCEMTLKRNLISTHAYTFCMLVLFASNRLTVKAFSEHFNCVFALLCATCLYSGWRGLVKACEM